MTNDEILERAYLHGYRSIPTAEQAMREALDLDRNSDVDPTRLLEFAAMLELREERMRQKTLTTNTNQR